MRFLLINQYYAPDYAATAQQLSDLCEELARQGHDVHVLAGRSLYDGRDIELPAEEVLNGVKVHRLKLATGKRGRFRERMVDYAAFYLKAFLRIHTLPRPDVVVTLTTPPLISLLGTWLRVTRKTRFVYWVMDVYPDIATRAGVLRSWGPARLLWASLGRISYMTANKVVVLGEDMKRVLRRKGVGERKIEVIQSWACREEVFPEDAAGNPFRAAHVRDREFAVMYSGNMGACHTFSEVVGAVRGLNRDGARMRFLFVGGGKRLPEVKAALDPCSNVEFLPYQDRADLCHSLSAADVHLITLQPKYDGLLVPSKLYAVMAAARPVVLVGSRNNEVARIIGESGCGIVCPPGDPDALAAALRRLEADPEERRAMGEAARRYFLENFDRALGVERFAFLLEAEGLAPGVRGFRKLAHRSLAYMHREHAVPVGIVAGKPKA